MSNVDLRVPPRRGPMEPGRSSECNSKVGVSLGNILAGRTMADFRHFLKNPRPPFARIFLGPISPDLWNRSATNRNKTEKAPLPITAGPEGFQNVPSLMADTRQQLTMSNYIHPSSTHNHTSTS